MLIVFVIRTLRGDRLLDLSADAGYGLDGRPLKLRHFERGGEHVLDVGGVLEDLVRHTGQLELLDDLERVVRFEHDARGRDAEGGQLRRAVHVGQHSRSGRSDRTIDRRQAMHVLGGVLEEASAIILVLHGIHGQDLETTPTDTEDQRIVGFQNLMDTKGETKKKHT